MRPRSLSGIVSTNLYRMQIFDNTTGSPVITGTNPAISIPNISVTESFDNDVSHGMFGGSINWYDYFSDGVATSYALYFVDGNNVKLQSIAEITQSNLTSPAQGQYYPTYEINLPNGTAIPTGAKRIGIFGKTVKVKGLTDIISDYGIKLTTILIVTILRTGILVLRI